MVPSCRVATRMTSASSPQSQLHTSVQSIQWFTEKWRACLPWPGQTSFSPFLSFPSSLGFGWFCSYIEAGTRDSGGPQPLIPGVQYKGRDVLCRDCSCCQFLAGLRAVSILTGPRFRGRRPASPPPAHRCCHCRRRVTARHLQAQMDGLFLGWRSCLGALGRASFWVQFAHFFFPVVCCVWRIETAFSPCPSTCPISGFITGG